MKLAKRFYLDEWCISKNRNPSINKSAQKAQRLITSLVRNSENDENENNGKIIALFTK